MTNQTEPSKSQNSKDHLFIIIDDPIKSPPNGEQLECVRHWYESPPLPISGTVIIGFWKLPWHEYDLASRLLEACDEISMSTEC